MERTGAAPMLRITNVLTASGSVFTLCGQLAGPWVSELRSSWEQARVNMQGQRCLVDLSDVTFIDEDGAKLLRQMHCAGVRFVAAGVDTKHVVDHLQSTDKQPLRKFMTHLATGCSPPEDR